MHVPVSLIATAAPPLHHSSIWLAIQATDRVEPVFLDILHLLHDSLPLGNLYVGWLYLCFSP